jgi:hypothetical protein
MAQRVILEKCSLENNVKSKSDPEAQRKSSLSDCTWLEMSLDLLILKP